MFCSKWVKRLRRFDWFRRMTLDPDKTSYTLSRAGRDRFRLQHNNGGVHGQADALRHCLDEFPACHGWQSL